MKTTQTHTRLSVSLVQFLLRPPAGEIWLLCLAVSCSYSFFETWQVLMHEKNMYDLYINICKFCLKYDITHISDNIEIWHHPYFRQDWNMTSLIFQTRLKYDITHISDKIEIWHHPYFRQDWNMTSPIFQTRLKYDITHISDKIEIWHHPYFRQDWNMTSPIFQTRLKYDITHISDKILRLLSSTT